MKDCVHFMTQDGCIFTTRGDTHPEGLLLSAGIYYPNKNGEREYEGIRYYKEIDEYGDRWIKNNHLEYIIQSKKGKQIFVPTKDIKKYFDPFEISDKTRFDSYKTKWGNLIKLLEELIPEKDIGFIGSRLIGFSLESSDIDILIRGINNLQKIKRNFDYILTNLNATKNLDEHITKISIQKYYNLYSRDKNNFSKMIENRWPTIKTKDYMTKLRFVPLKGEIKFPKLGERLKKIKINGRVTEDIGTNFMPRFFKINSENEEYNVLTYFWDYTYCVKNEDRVIINGDLFEDNVIAITNRDKHGINFI